MWLPRLIYSHFQTHFAKKVLIWFSIRLKGKTLSRLEFVKNWKIYRMFVWQKKVIQNGPNKGFKLLLYEFLGYLKSLYSSLLQFLQTTIICKHLLCRNLDRIVWGLSSQQNQLNFAPLKQIYYSPTQVVSFKILTNVFCLNTKSCRGKLRMSNLCNFILILLLILIWQTAFQENSGREVKWCPCFLREFHAE